MSFKVGERVRVIAHINRHMGDPYGITSSMETFAGKIVTIYRAKMSNTGSRELYIIEGNTCNWSAQLFEKLAYTPDEAFQSYLHGDMSEQDYEELIRRERG